MNVERKSFRNNLIRCLASGFYSGYIPKAPGTFGTLSSIPIYFLLSALAATVPYLVSVGMFALFSSYIAAQAERLWAERDCPKIVLDEWTGFFVTMIAIPPSFGTVAAGFSLFRFFDILKPFPIGYAERMPGGAGVVLDDIIAGSFSCLVLHLSLGIIA